MTYQNPQDPWGQQQQPGQQPGYGQQPPAGYGQQPPPGYGQQPPGYGTPPGYQPYPSSPGANAYGGPTLAGWGYRVGAFVIDEIILFVVALIFRAIGGALLSDLVAIVGQAIYQTLLIGSSGRTVGNMALGTQVLDANTGQTIGYARAFVRWLIATLLAFAFIIGFLLDVLWPLWDSRNQTLHDKVASSVMVLKRR